MQVLVKLGVFYFLKRLVLHGDIDGVVRQLGEILSDCLLSNSLLNFRVNNSPELICSFCGVLVMAEQEANEQYFGGIVVAMVEAVLVLEVVMNN